MALPIKDSLRGQILSLIGIVLSAAIALSSTNFLGNALAGMMLRGIRNFKMGDYIQVQDNFGRVCSRGLLSVEIQGEDRNFTSLPNLYLITNPVKVIHQQGTIVFARVSLGYDVERHMVSELLVEAAIETEIKEPFVLIDELGDFSITYRISGLLEDSAYLLSVRSRLMGHVLDSLHKANVEIVSPTFMNTRAVHDQSFIPPILYQKGNKIKEDEVPEEIIFDKANLAEETENLRNEIRLIEKEIHSLKAMSKDKEFDKSLLEALQLRADGLTGEKESLVKILRSKEKELQNNCIEEE
jgi:small conductance mechanosensitive channel